MSETWDDLKRFHWNEDGAACTDPACTKSHWLDGHAFDAVRAAEAIRHQFLDGQVLEQTRIVVDHWNTIEAQREQLVQLREALACELVDGEARVSRLRAFLVTPAPSWDTGRQQDPRGFLYTDTAKVKP